MLELAPKKVLKTVNNRENAILLGKMERERIFGNDKPKKVDLLKVSYTIGEPTADWKSWDNEKVKQEVLKRTLSGENTKMAIETLKNFDVDKIDAKIAIIQDFNNDPKTIQKYTELYEI